jgi:hypothetical protein
MSRSFSLNQIVKIAFHLFAFGLMLYLATNKAFRLPVPARIALVAISLAHAYDTWWFFNQDGNAPI